MAEDTGTASVKEAYVVLTLNGWTAREQETRHNIVTRVRMRDAVRAARKKGFRVNVAALNFPPIWKEPLT